MGCGRPNGAIIPLNHQANRPITAGFGALGSEPPGCSSYLYPADSQEVEFSVNSQPGISVPVKLRRCFLGACYDEQK